MGSLNLLTHDGTVYGDWRDDFYEKGYAVVKGAVPLDNAEHYQSKMMDWLKSFNLGFDPKDKSTWKTKNRPQSFKGG